jgi:hypothetical protein
MRQAGNGTSEVYTGFCCGNLKEKCYLEDLGVDRIILNWIFNKAVGSH